MNDIALHVAQVQGVSLTVSESGTLPLGIGGSMYAIGTPYYDGSYTITPTSETQVIDIKELRGRDDITINPIPNNYGLITWNGSTLMVS